MVNIWGYTVFETDNYKVKTLVSYGKITGYMLQCTHKGYEWVNLYYTDKKHVLSFLHISGEIYWLGYNKYTESIQLKNNSLYPLTNKK